MSARAEGKPVDYEKLSDREIDALVAERVMGWTLVTNEHFSFWHDSSTAVHLPNFSTDDNAARLMRDRIGELGLVTVYIDALALLLNLGPADFHERTRRSAVCAISNAKPRQQMIAALKAREGHHAARSTDAA